LQQAACTKAAAGCRSCGPARNWSRRNRRLDSFGL
jgi:hypothetical protein